MEKNMETNIVYRDYIGIMEKKMETTIPTSSNLAMNWGYIGIVEKNMETTIVYREYIGIMERKWKLLYRVVQTWL